MGIIQGNLATISMSSQMSFGSQVEKMKHRRQSHVKTCRDVNDGAMRSGSRASSIFGGWESQCYFHALLLEHILLVTCCFWPLDAAVTSQQSVATYGSKSMNVENTDCRKCTVARAVLESPQLALSEDPWM